MQKHFFVLGKWLRRSARLASALCFANLLFLGIIPLLPKTTIAYAQGNPITGLVFQDYNGDGFRNTASTPTSPALDPPVAGVVVTAYDSQGQTAGSAVTGADGRYTITVNEPGPFRVEFSTFPAGLHAGFTSVSSQSNATNPPWGANTAGSTVQFVIGNSATNLNLALMRAADYCQAQPTLVSSCYAQNSTVLGDSSEADPVILDFPYDANGTTPASHALQIKQQDIGAVWGLAYQRTTDQIYAAAYMKRFTSFGPGGAGAIYRAQRKPDPGQAQLFVDLNALFGPNTAGPDLHNFALHKDYKTDAASGLNTVDAVGKTSLGGLDIDDAEHKLYVMNLYDRQLYEIPLDATPTVNNIRRTPAPLNQNTLAKDVCPNPATDIRPFAVEYYQGRIYVGMVCSGESSPVSPEFATWQDSNGDGYWNLGEPYTDLNGNGKLDYHVTTDLHAYVYTVDPATLTFSATPVLSFPLDYPGIGLHAGVPADWNTWQPSFRPLEGARLAYPQPMLTGIAFDRGNMLLGLRDRFGDQAAYKGVAVNPNNENNLAISSGAGGDILRACGNPTSGWTLENNAQCGGITTAGANDGQGPGNGEYYYQDNFGGHSETSQGSLANAPGFPQVVVNSWDPLALNSQGVRWLDNSTGAQDHAYFIFPNSTIGSARWGKGNGLGDLVALCDPAPIELGNRIWLDVNGNGIQDPNEPGIEGVTVHLYRLGYGPDGLPGTPDDKKPLALAVTDANGDYYFDSGPGPDPLIDEIGIVTSSIQAGATYEIRLDKAGDYQQDEALYGLSLTERDDATPSPSGSDRNDSDAVNVTNPVGSAAGVFPVITYTTGGPGENDHTLDFGFTPSGVSIGNEVWFDTNNNGQIDRQESGIANVTVDLFSDANNNGLLEPTEQTPIATQQTTAQGFYLFTKDSNQHSLPPGNYVVGIAPTNFTTGGVLAGYHSSGLTLASNGAFTETVAPAADGNADNDDNGQAQGTGFYVGGVLSSVLHVLNDEPINEIAANQPDALPGTTLGLSDPNRDNASNLTVDFGFYTVALGDRVFVDAANNGVRDGADVGLNAVTVRLFAADGVTEIPVGPDGVLGTADDVPGGMVTANRGDGDGQYLFRGLAQGDYVVNLAKPVGYTSSSGNPNDQAAGPYEPAPDPDTTALGKMLDNDDNGSLAGGASSIASLPVTLPPGDARLPNPADVDNSKGATWDRTVDFGLIHLVDANQYSLGNRVWFDMGAGSHRNNGVLDADEHGAPNITVTLYLSTTNGLTLTATSKTDENGYYRFSNLPPGDYVVEAAKPADYTACTNGLETDPNLDVDSNNDGVNSLANSMRSNGLTLGPGDSEPTNEADIALSGQGSLDARANMTLDFCLVLNSPLSLGNQVFADRNNDGVFDPATEVGIPGVQVNLYYDLNGDGVVDESEATQPYLTTTTYVSGTVAGYYLFTNLQPGNYVVELPPDNFVLGAPLQSYVSCSGRNGAATGPYEPAGDPNDPSHEADLADKGSQYVNPSTGATSIRTAPIVLQPNTEPLLNNVPDGDGIPANGILDSQEWPQFSNDPNTPDSNSNLTVDLCVFKPYSLGNRVWFDANGSGLIDDAATLSENGIGGVVVSLYAVNASLVATTTTDGLGYYRFDHLMAGDYTVDVVTPISPINHQPMISTLPDAGDPDGNPTDSDDNGVDLSVPGHVRSTLVTLGDAQTGDTEPTGETDLSNQPGAAPDARADLTVDFGFYEPVSIGSRIFDDAENKCYRVSGQLNGLINTVVYLYEDRNDDSIPDGTAIMSQTTNFAGDYLFVNLRPGTYMVQIVPPSGYVSSTGKQGSLTDGPCEGLQSIDPDEGPGGGINNDDNGIVQSNGQIFSKPMTLTDREENAADSSLDPDTNRTLDFGVFRPLSLGNLVWDDLNDDGLFDNGELGLDGVMVNLYHDENFDGVISGPELTTPVATTLTQNGGQYLFTGLGRGVYAVELAASNFQVGGRLAGYVSSDGAANGHPKLYEPAPSPDDPIGPQGNPIDNDDNGQMNQTQNNELSLLSSMVTLQANNEPQGETPNNDPTTPDANANLTVDFGVYQPFSLGNRVWLDANNNGRVDADEHGIANVVVDLYLGDGITKTGSTTTDANGYYRFDVLPAGNYIAEVNASNFMTASETTAGVLFGEQSSTPDEVDPNSDLDSGDNGVGNAPDPQNGIRSAPVQLGLGGVEPVQESDLVSGTTPQGSNDNFANMTVDFGFYQPVCVGHRVWLDANKNGLQDEGEAGIAGVTVTLYRSDNTEVAHIVTQSDGAYRFCNLPPGDYYVQFTLPPDYQLSPKDQGTGDTQDSDVDPTTGRTPVIVLKSGDFDLKWDAGVYIAPTALDETNEPTQVYRLFMPIVER
ncbi:MAG: SdrD B-like domain-containing protein [Caldilineaceae bacterium]